ncbi:MAG TPA: ectoine/hydroxyectoine ABC transporter ATP-binding protein EhuA [Spirochaetota bacterium]|nr:ectoine/hydroxyectoine ABC transporter ATP-binding protein EhuA [Spirochaetota bacterium]HPQ55079.1 ectoine/hydroxyectoine ABC transporter ATP-binding protein EhuA [Spirochaetota bacterium]
MSKPLIQFTDVTKKFGDHIIFDGFNFSVFPQEIVTIIGPSGSGKSTILRMLMTLEKLDGGFIQIEDEYVWHMKKNEKLVPASEAHLRKMRKKISMVFQHFNLFPHMTVLRNVTEAPVHVLKLEKEEARLRAVELLETVGLGDKIDAYPAQLSGGQKQRVGIARALAMQPSILLLDEITSALDPELVGEVLDVIRNVAKEHRHTMLIVTHEMYFAEEIADRICFLEGGAIVEEGAPRDLFYNPREQRTKDFLQSYMSGKAGS